jgi:trans-aconitate methyltransferase
MTLVVLVLSAIMLSGCEDLAVRDPASLLAPRFQWSEVIGFLAGAGTTFAALPDLIAMSRFETCYADLVARAYPRRPDGRTLFPFRRLFIVATAP